MALLERVSMLIRANLNDLIDQAEEPEKLIKQVILDMQNHLLQVKTQVAISIADQHVLEKKQAEAQGKIEEWMRKAELAVSKNQDDLARAAIDRSMSYRQMAENFTHQVADQKLQVETLKNALQRLEQKLAEAQAKSDLLMAQHRRSRALRRASEAGMAAGTDTASGTFDRMNDKVLHAEALSKAVAELNCGNMDDRLARLEKEDQIEALLAGIKARRKGATGQD